MAGANKWIAFIQQKMMILLDRWSVQAIDAIKLSINITTITITVIMKNNDNQCSNEGKWIDGLHRSAADKSATIVRKFDR